MTNQEAIRHLKNMKWLKGYDNTTVGGAPLGDIIDQIIVLLKEQETVEPKQVIRKQCKTEHSDGSIDYYAEWFCPHCNSLLKRGFDAAWIEYCFKCGKPILWESDEVE